MASVGGATVEDWGVAVPWWRRYTRWRQTSNKEALASEQALLALSGCKVETATTAATGCNDRHQPLSAECAPLKGPPEHSPASSGALPILRISDVQVGPHKCDYIHTTTGGLGDATTADSPALVVLPGYCQGSAYWFRTLRGLASGFNLHVIDHLGTGLSGRPSFNARSREETEDFFVSSLETWRKQQGLERMVVLGHSLGGYLATCYAMKHPERVQHLVLVSPAGIGRQPEDWQPPTSLLSPWTMRGALFRALIKLWDVGATPGTVVRAMGPWAPQMLENYGKRRYTRGHHLNEVEVKRFGSYAYHILAARGSGEFALRHLLAPFAWPRAAIEDRTEGLRGIPITFIYGDQDWMDYRYGERMAAAIREEREPLFASDLQVMRTPNAGHYPFIDQPGVFLQQVVQACESYMPAAAARRVLAVAKASPFWSGPIEDEGLEMAEEMKRNPVEAQIHVATEL